MSHQPHATILASVSLSLISAGSAIAAELTIPHLPQPVRTERMGAVDVPPVEQLREMHDSPYILHARDGKLSAVEVEKIRLPEDPGNVQVVWMVKAADGAIYVRRTKHICRSTDGGRSWTAPRIWRRSIVHRFRRSRRWSIRGSHWRGRVAETTYGDEIHG